MGALQILGGCGARLGGNADSQGPEFRFASVQGREAHCGNSGIGRGFCVDRDHGDCSLRIYRIKLVRFAFVGHDKLRAIRREGDRIGHDANGHGACGRHGGGAADPVYLEKEDLAFGVAGRVSSFHGYGHQPAAAHRHAVGRAAQGDQLFQAGRGWIADVNNRKLVFAADRENKL